MTPLVMAALVLAQPGPPANVRTSLGTKGDVWVGQRVTLVVELLAPGTFAGAPAFDLPAVPGVLILKPEDRPTLGTEDAGGTTYTVQRHEFAVYPQRAGAVTIPAFPVRFESSAGFGQPTTPQRVTTSPVTFTAKRPPGTEGLATVVTTRDLSVTESWKPEPGPAAVGARSPGRSPSRRGTSPGWPCRRSGSTRRTVSARTRSRRPSRTASSAVS